MPENEVNSDRIRACIIGVGNCCTSLITGIVSYAKNQDLTGIAYKNIAGYSPDSIDFVLAFEVDKRKVGKPINEAILQKPNCTPLLCSEDDLKNSSIQFGMTYKGPVMDGISSLMNTVDDDHGFRVDDSQPECTREEIISLIKENKVDVIVNYLPVGSQKCTEFWAEVCLETKTPLMNCIPVFLASDEIWSERFRQNGVAICGDDMRSFLGASVLSSRLQSLFNDRGVKTLCHIQQNSGGNTDFLTLSDKARLTSKKISKENVLKNEFILSETNIGDSYLHAGPSDYIQYYGDTKVATLRLEGLGFGGFPITLDCRLSVVDSANSAGVVIDSIRFLKVASRMGITGPIYGPSAYYQKTPPKPLTFEEAKRSCDEMAAIHFD